jgi:tetratricopeptide (TPR) repeat protein
VRTSGHRPRTTGLGLALVLLVVLPVLVGCSRASNAPASELLPVGLPDLSKMDAAVQQQAKERLATVSQKQAAGATGDDLGRAFGELGMLLQAAEYYEAARPAYLNAQTLMPNEHRWPYYLGLLYRSLGDTANAVQSFSRALQLRSSDLPTLVWLGRTYIDQGQPDQAEPLLRQAQGLAPQSAAVLAALGQAALARRDFQAAVTLFEEALAAEPTATSIHAPLANAYRGLGNNQQAEAHLKQWRNTELGFPDPWKQELDMTIESGLAYELRGVRALEQRDFATAAQLFRKGVALAPGTTMIGRSLRHKLGTALALTGDAEGATRQFEETVRFAPADGFDEPVAKAYYSLGVIAASTGAANLAARRLNDAVRYNPSYVEARLLLADILRRSGRAEAAIAQYGEVVRISPRAAAARVGQAMALAQLGRYADARAALEDVVRTQPGQAELANGLARLLAAAPDPRVRDGQRALTLVQEVARTTSTTAVGETMAMALAEVGNFSEAVNVQRSVLQAAADAGTRDAIPRLTANLRLYESGRPCRMPWTDEESVVN